jgi:hypothetical protein
VLQKWNAHDFENDYLRVPETLRRAEITGFDASEIDHEFLQDDTRIDHPEFERVVASLLNGMRRLHFADTVFDGLAPVAQGVLREGVDNLRRLVIERDCKT